LAQELAAAPVSSIVTNGEAGRSPGDTVRAGADPATTPIGDWTNRDSRHRRADGRHHVAP
jgi:hypothetical protein